MNVAINGFGRIGRSFLRLALERNLNIVAINDIGSAETLFHLFKYDSVHGGFKGHLDCVDGVLKVNGKTIQIMQQEQVTALPWKTLNVDVVIESTGRALKKEEAAKHIDAGASQVIVSAPAAKDIPLVVMGVNEHQINLSDTILSNASCTTNNVATMIKVLDDHWGIKEGYITTVHSMTGDQNLHDAPHKDLRRARAASASIIPTSTGAAKAITQVFPHLEGRLGGAGIRVPVLNGSLTDFTCLLKKATTVSEINTAFKTAATTTLKNILEYTEDQIVSADILGNLHSCIFDAGLTSIVGDLIKVVGWYDNEYGYASRLVDLVQKIQHRNVFN